MVIPRDSTIAVAKKLRPDIIVLIQPNKGKGDALKCGLKYASGDIVVTLDADGATDPMKCTSLSLLLKVVTILQRVLGWLTGRPGWNALYTFHRKFNISNRY